MRSALDTLSPFSKEEYGTFTSLIKIKQLSKGEYLFREGEIDRYVPLVNKGCLRYYLIDNHGDEHTIYFTLENWWVGDIQSFFSETPSPHPMEALENCKLFTFTPESFQYAIDNIMTLPIFRTAAEYSAAETNWNTQLYSLSGSEISSINTWMTNHGY